MKWSFFTAPYYVALTSTSGAPSRNCTRFVDMFKAGTDADVHHVPLDQASRPTGHWWTRGLRRAVVVPHS